MPTISLHGITLDLSADAAAVAQRWIDPLQTAAQSLLQLAPTIDPRLQAVFTTTGLAPIFRGLVGELQDATALLTQGGVAPTDPSTPVAASINDLITRYLDGFLAALERLLDDWEKLGPIFFTSGEGPDALRHRLRSLGGVDPLPAALAAGGQPSLVYHFQLERLGDPTLGTLAADLVYLPRDVETDCTLVGATTHLCAGGATYEFAPTPCSHASCRSVAERVNATLGDPAAIPTCVIWPAWPASDIDCAAPGDCYGYRERLSAGLPQDNTVASAQAPEVAAFYRALGRQLALAYACGVQDVEAGDFIVHRQRPYWLELACAFATPNEDLRATGMFDAPAGPLAPPSRSAPSASSFGLLIAGPGGRTPATPACAPASVPDVRRGCAEALEALATLGPELSERFQRGRNLLSWFQPRDSDETRDHQRRWLELLSLASSWSDWQAIDRETAQWRAADDLEWTQRWFGGLLAQLQPTVPAWTQLPPEALETLEPLRDRVTGALRVRTFQEVRVDGILALAPAEREPIWRALVSIAALLSGYFRRATWTSTLATSWDPLPLSALVEFEAADHARARLPYFLHRLQLASLWAAGNGQEVNLAGCPDAPPPRLARDTFFPESMASATARQLASLANPGVRAWLVSTIPGLMGAPSPPRPALPAGPSLIAAPATSP